MNAENVVEVIRVKKLRDSPLDGSGCADNPGDIEVRAEVVLKSRLPFNLTSCDVVMKLTRQHVPVEQVRHGGHQFHGHHGHGRDRRPSHNSPSHSPSSSLSWQSSGPSSYDLDSEVSLHESEGKNNLITEYCTWLKGSLSPTREDIYGAKCHAGCKFENQIAKFKFSDLLSICNDCWTSTNQRKATL